MAMILPCKSNGVSTGIAYCPKTRLCFQLSLFHQPLHDYPILLMSMPTVADSVGAVSLQVHSKIWEFTCNALCHHHPQFLIVLSPAIY